MANTNVYRGSDGSISVSVDSGAEGDSAQAVIDAYSLTPVGRVTGVSVNVASDLKPFHELGQRYATELRPGNVNVSGSIDRAFINGALLKMFLGDAASSRPAGTFISPTFNLNLRMENPAKSGTSSSITLYGVKLENWSFDIPEDDFVMEKVGFQALWVGVEDAEG
jgi:tail tube protein